MTQDDNILTKNNSHLTTFTWIVIVQLLTLFRIRHISIMVFTRITNKISHSFSCLHVTEHSLITTQAVKPNVILPVLKHSPESLIHNANIDHLQMFYLLFINSYFIFFTPRACVIK